MTRAALALGALAALPLTPLPPYYLYLLSTAYLWAAMATAWRLLERGGQISFGHAAFFGVGAYGAALASLDGVRPWLGVAVAAALAALAGALVGLAAGRLAGGALALGTLAAAELLRGLALAWTPVTGGGAGLIGLPAMPALPGFAGPRAGTYHVALLTLGVALAIAAGVGRSRIGLALATLRESEERAVLLGLHPLPWKILAFALSAAIAGLAGGAYAHAVGAVDPEVVFGRFVSLAPLVVATLGAPLGLAGPALAAATMHLVSELVLHPLAPAFHQLPYGVVLVGVILSPFRTAGGPNRR